MLVFQPVSDLYISKLKAAALSEDLNSVESVADMENIAVNAMLFGNINDPFNARPRKYLILTRYSSQSSLYH